MVSPADVRLLLEGGRDLEARDVRELLYYDPDTGLLTWKWRDRKWFCSDWGWPRWNTRYAGKPAFVCGRRYKRGGILGRLYKASRIIWLYMTGSWPEGEIDHKNHICSDDRYDNLRDVSHQENSRNQRLPSDNHSGVCGVRRCKNGKFRAEIRVDDKSITLGRYDTLVGAKKARKTAERLYGFSESHGVAL